MSRPPRATPNGKQFRGTARGGYAGLAQLDSASSGWLIFNTLCRIGGIHGVTGDSDALGAGSNQIEPSDYRVDRAGFVIRSAVQMARHEATYGS